MAVQSVYHTCADSGRENAVQITPGQAIAMRGLQKKWVAGQLGISPSYLSMLLGGERGWTPELIRQFPLVVGMASDAISFALSCAAAAQEACEGRIVPAEPLDSPQERVSRPRKGSGTCDPQKARQSANSGEAGDGA